MWVQIIFKISPLGEDHKNIIWAVSYTHLDVYKRQGLVKLINPYEPEHFSFKTFRNIKGNSHSLLDNIIYAIAQDKNSGKLWIGSRSGVSILEDESGDGNFTNIVPGNLQGDLPFHEVNSLLCSQDGLLWLGMLGVCLLYTS